MKKRKTKYYHWFKLLQSLKNLLIPFINVFGKKKLLVAFEYGVILSEVAKEKGIVLTPEIVGKAEVIILDVFRRNNTQNVAVEMIPTILSIFEPDISN